MKPSTAPKLRKSRAPGIPVPEGEAIDICNKSLRLTYKTHIPKDDYKEWFRDTVMPQFYKEGRIIFLELAHETADEDDPWDHTHVVIQTVGIPLRADAQQQEEEYTHPPRQQRQRIVLHMS